MIALLKTLLKNRAIRPSLEFSFRLFLHLGLFAVSRIVPLRICLLTAERIGHMLGNTEPWLRYRDRHKHSLPVGLVGNFQLWQQRQSPLKKKWQFTIFFANSPANRQIMDMLKRRLPINENRLLRWGLRRLRHIKPQELYPGRYRFYGWLERKLGEYFPLDDVWLDLPSPGVYQSEVWNDIWNNSGPQLSFTEEEHARGQDLLRSLGVAPGAQYMCFFSRDQAYLPVLYDQIDQDWHYHDYRNGEINSLLPTAEYFAEREIYALRVGSVVEESIPEDSSFIIDYASKHRSDFADAYLMANAKLFLGDTAGIFYMAAVFDVPCVAVNMIPLAHYPHGLNDLYLPKKYKCSVSQQILSFREVIRLGAVDWKHSQEYRDAGLQPINNTADEILAVAMELNERIDATWRTREEDSVLQRQFNQLFPDELKAEARQCLVGSQFLRQNKDLLV